MTTEAEKSHNDQLAAIHRLLKGGETGIEEIEERLMGGYYPLDDEGAALKIDRPVEVVHRFREAGVIFGYRTYSGEIRYPDWQFRWDGQPYDEMVDVLAALDRDQWLVLRFMLTHHAEIAPHTAAEWMKHSRTPNLGELARAWKRGLESTSGAAH
jgi:hypothetical protein